MSEFVQNTKRRLPHIQLTDSILFITWRLAFDLPEHIKEEIINNSKPKSNSNLKIVNTADNIISDTWMNGILCYDQLLGEMKASKINLSKLPYLDIIKNSILHDNGSKYKLLSYCIMPNHVHIVIKPLLKCIDRYYTISEIMRDIKSVTAHKINEIEHKKGQVWQTESYDHVVRDEAELLRILEYMLHNPIKAGFVDKWEEWDGIYIDRTFL